MGNTLYLRDDLHTSVEWLLASLVLLLSAARPGAAAFILGIGLGTREWFWLVAPFWGAWAIANLRREKAWTVIAWGALGTGLALSPCLAARGLEFTKGSSFRWQGLENVPSGASLLQARNFGFSWIFLESRSGGALLWAAGLAWSAVFCLFLTRRRSLSDSAAWGGLALCLFQLFCPCHLFQTSATFS